MVTLRKYLLVILFLLSIVLMLIAYVFDLSGKSNTVTAPIAFFSVGSSILATVIFAWLYESRIDDLLYRSNRERYEELTPLESFPASDSPIKAFNNLYNDALAKTAMVRYKGDRALYLAYRLHKHVSSRTPWMRIELLLPNPRNEDLFYYRAQNLVGLEKYKDNTIAEISKKLKIDLFASIVAFGDMRESYNFEVYFFDEIPFLRYEIMDSILVVSALTMQQYGYYPPTLVYSKASLFYSTFLTNFNQVKDLASKGTAITQSNFSEELVTSLARESSLKIAIGDLRNVYTEYFKRAS
jgi:hypothetical protein